MGKFETFQFAFAPGISSTDDLKAECRRLLKVAKQILESRKQLVPMGFVVKPDGRLDLYTRNTEPESWRKKASHALLSAQAKTCNAIAVILLQDTWIKMMHRMDVSKREEFIRNYRQGDLETEPDRREAVALFAYGPSINYAVACFYHRAVGGSVIVWDETIDSTELPEIAMEQNLVDPWWDTDKKPVVS